MVVEIQCLRELNQSACSVPNPATEGSGPFKKYYLASRDLLRGTFYTKLYLDPGSCSGITQSTGPKSLFPGESSYGGNGA